MDYISARRLYDSIDTAMDSIVNAGPSDAWTALVNALDIARKELGAYLPDGWKCPSMSRPDEGEQVRLLMVDGRETEGFYWWVGREMVWYVAESPVSSYSILGWRY